MSEKQKFKSKQWNVKVKEGCFNSKYLKANVRDQNVVNIKESNSRKRNLGLFRAFSILVASFWRNISCRRTSIWVKKEKILESINIQKKHPWYNIFNWRENSIYCFCTSETFANTMGTRMRRTHEFDCIGTLFLFINFKSFDDLDFLWSSLPPQLVANVVLSNSSSLLNQQEKPQEKRGQRLPHPTCVPFHVEITIFLTPHVSSFHVEVSPNTPHSLRSATKAHCWLWLWL